MCQLYQVRMAGNTNVFHKWKPWFINMIISFQHIECIFPPSHSTFHAMTSATWTAWRVLLLENQGAGIWGMKTSSGQVKVHWVKVYLSSLRAIGTGDELKHLLSRTQLHLKQNLILKLSIKTSNRKQMLKITSANTKIGEKIETYWLRRAKLMIILRIRPRNKKIWPGEIQNFENQEIHMVVHAPSRMTKSEEEGLLTIVTTFVSEIYFSMWFLESSCVDDSEYVPNLPAAMYIFFTTSVQSKNLTFLGVRSTNPLPAASGLVKLTRSSHADSRGAYGSAVFGGNDVMSKGRFPMFPYVCIGEIWRQPGCVSYFSE